MTPLDKLCTTAQRIRDRADERDMAWRELKGAAEAIERMEQDVEVEGGGAESRSAGPTGAVNETQVPRWPTGRSLSSPSRISARPAVLNSALGFWSLAAAVVLATWGLAVLLENPAGKPTPPFYKHFQERLEQ